MTSPVPEMNIRAVGIRHAEQRFQTPQAAITAPVLGQFDGRAGQVAEFLQLALEALEQCCARASWMIGKIEIEVRAIRSGWKSWRPPGMEENDQQLQGMFRILGGGRARARANSRSKEGEIM